MTDRLTCAEVRAEKARLYAVIEATENALDALQARCLHDETTTRQLEYQGAWVACAGCRTYIGPVEVPRD